MPAAGRNDMHDRSPIMNVIRGLRAMCVAAACLGFATAEGAVAQELTLSTPSERSVVQRDARNLADVAVAGHYTGHATRFEARVVARDGFAGTSTEWGVIDSDPAGNAFSGSIRVAGGWYDLQVRSLNEETVLATQTLPRVGVGEVFVTAGQSNSANYGSAKLHPQDDRVSARVKLNDNTWQLADDSQPIATGTGGSPWPVLGDLMAEEMNVPVGFISVGVGATRIEQWLPGSDHYEKRLKPAVQSLGTNGFRAVLWHQGESDSIHNTTTETYARRLESIIDQCRADAGFEVPWLVAIASFHPHTRPEQEARVSAGQRQVIAGYERVFEGAQTDGFTDLGYLASDGVHFNADGLNEHAKRWLDQILTAGIIDTLSADIDRDGMVGRSDYAILMNEWGNTTDPYRGADVDGSGVVDHGDLDLMREQWGDGDFPQPTVPETCSIGQRGTPLASLPQHGCECSVRSERSCDEHR